MLDGPTVRFEGQLLPRQFQQSTAVVQRLKLENQKVPAAQRKRFTINTLVRVAMTVLLEHKNALHGATEDELLESFRRSIAKRAGEES